MSKKSENSSKFEAMLPEERKKIILEVLAEREAEREYIESPDYNGGIAYNTELPKGFELTKKEKDYMANMVRVSRDPEPVKYYDPNVRELSAETHQMLKNSTAARDAFEDAQDAGENPKYDPRIISNYPESRRENPSSLGKINSNDNAATQPRKDGVKQKEKVVSSDPSHLSKNVDNPKSSFSSKLGKISDKVKTVMNRENKKPDILPSLLDKKNKEGISGRGGR